MLRPPRPQALSIEGPAGSLEALLEEPETGRGAAFGVVCHPHPLQGGTLENKVVHTLARALQGLGIPTLRFNYRGVGKSEGAYDEGIGETEDALAVVRAGRVRWPHASVWLLGFSFGGIVALRAAARLPAAGLVTVAPAIGRLAVGDRIPECPWLVVQGDSDEVVAPASVLEWARGLEAAPRVEVMAGAGHFYHGRLPELREKVVRFVRETAPEITVDEAQDAAG